MFSPVELFILWFVAITCGMALKNYTRAFAGWNLFAIIMLVVAAESVSIAIFLAVLR